MESESVSPTSAIDDMVTEQLGEPSGGDTQAATQVESAPEPVAVAPDPVSQEQPAIQAVAPLGEPNTQTAPLPTSQTYRIGDRDYTQKELNDALTSAQQLGHLQNKYVGLLEQQRQAEIQRQAPPSQTQATPQQTQQDWVKSVRQKYDPVVQDAVKQGLIEGDFAALFPGMAAQMLAYRDGFHQSNQMVQQISRELQGRQQKEQSQGLVNDMARNVQMLAQSGEAFAPLKDPGKVNEFFKYLYDLNPQIGHLRNPEFLARQWVAYNKDQYLQTAQTRAQAQVRAEQVRFARADATTAARPGGMSQNPPQTPLDAIVDDFYDRSV